MRNHDIVAADLGRSQLGLVTRSQLAKAGIDHRVVKRRTDARVWTVVFPRVIDLGTHPDSWEKQVMAKVLAAGDGAVASHLTAAFLHGLLDIQRPRDIDVMVLRGRGTEVDGSPLHITIRLDADERGMVGPIPTTSRLRTVLDIACDVSRDHLELLVYDEIRGRPEALAHLARIAERRPGWPGIQRAQRILEGAEAYVRAENLFEILWIRLLRRAGLGDLVEVQVEVHDDRGRFVGRVDILIRDARVIVECQGRRFHDTEHRLDRDEARSTQLRALGYHVIPVTWQDLEPPRCDEVIAEIRDHLAAATR